jgi:uncharacterized protein involved in exopolysaccharide biosynthesis
MTPERVETYLQQLARQLRRRGLEDSRIVEEAREHLADAVADGQARGLSLEDAEREAFERFGAPEIVAAHVLAEDHMSNRISAGLQAVWYRKWWILVPTVLTAIATSVMTYYFLPIRYRSEATIRATAARVPPEYVPTSSGRVHERLQDIRQLILSRTRLERVISELGLYQVERESAPIGEVVMQMRDDIDITASISEDGAQNADGGVFVVSFVSAEPKTAMEVTEHLAVLIIEENMRDRKVRTEGTTHFIDAQVNEVRRRLIEYEKRLEDLRRENGRQPLSQADLLPYEVLQDQYKALLIQSEQSKTARSLEQRQIGPQFRLLDPPRLPDRPMGPSRLGVNVAGTFLGLGLGIVAMAVRGRSKNPHLE